MADIDALKQKLKNHEARLKAIQEGAIIVEEEKGDGRKEKAIKRLELFIRQLKAAILDGEKANAAGSDSAKPKKSKE